MGTGLGWAGLSVTGHVDLGKLLPLSLAENGKNTDFPAGGWYTPFLSPLPHKSVTVFGMSQDSSPRCLGAMYFFND